jgi:hypothetical protein
MVAGSQAVSWPSRCSHALGRRGRFGSTGVPRPLQRPHVEAYRQDLRYFFGWTNSVGLFVLAATRPHIEVDDGCLDGADETGQCCGDAEYVVVTDRRTGFPRRCGRRRAIARANTILVRPSVSIGIRWMPVVRSWAIASRAPSKPSNLGTTSNRGSLQTTGSPRPRPL